jgi:hypothetical protein
MPYDRQVKANEAAYLLEIQSEDEVVRTLRGTGADNTAIASGEASFLFKDVLSYGLALVIEKVGVKSEKAHAYAEAVLHTPVFSRESAAGLLENETQELYCQVGDFQLTRIFLRNSENGKEVDIGAVKPVLFPITRTEINVSRALRPILYRAKKRGLIS